jgi:hypothetical protein
MIDLTKARKEFKKYIDNYNRDTTGTIIGVQINES